jgi:hypothetical protein
MVTTLNQLHLTSDCYSKQDVDYMQLYDQYTGRVIFDIKSLKPDQQLTLQVPEVISPLSAEEWTEFQLKQLKVELSTFNTDCKLRFNHRIRL